MTKCLDPNLLGKTAKTKYNYIINQFRVNYAKTAKIGEVKIKWQFYSILKGYMLKDLSVKSNLVIDTSEPSRIKKLF